MGGYGSGSWYRWDTTSKIDDSLNFSVKSLMPRAVKNDKDIFYSSSLIWSNKATGKKTSSIGFTINTINQDNMYVKLNYTSRKKPIEYKIPLLITYPNYGGHRFWFICPITHKKCIKLYSPSGHDYFLSRQAYKLKYASQSKSRHDRMLDKRNKLFAKLGNQEWPKPKYMHQKTYDKIRHAYYEAEDRCTMYLYDFIKKMDDAKSYGIF